MRTKQIYADENFHCGYGAGSGYIERYKYLCPCGKGEIIEEHDNIPGFRDHDVYLCCPECEKKYQFDLTKGVRNWELIEKDGD